MVVAVYIYIRSFNNYTAMEILNTLFNNGEPTYTSFLIFLFLFIIIISSSVVFLNFVIQKILNK